MLHLLNVCALYVCLCDYVNICMYLVLLCIFGKKLLRPCVYCYTKTPETLCLLLYKNRIKIMFSLYYPTFKYFLTVSTVEIA
jgi:hypothetical protein